MIAEDVSRASQHLKKAEEIVGEVFELFVEADEVLLLADKEGFECLREIFCYSEKVQSGEAFGHSVEDFGHWGEVFWSSVEDFGHLEEVFGHSVEDFEHWGEVFWPSVEDFGYWGEVFGPSEVASEHSGRAFWHSVDAFGHFEEAFGIAFGHFVDVSENPVTAPGHLGLVFGCSVELFGVVVDPCLVIVNDWEAFEHSGGDCGCFGTTVEFSAGFGLCSSGLGDESFAQLGRFSLVVKQLRKADEYFVGNFCPHGKLPGHSEGAWKSF